MTERANKPPAAVVSETPWVDADLDKLQRDTFGYLLHETNPANGLVIDKTAKDRSASIAATGLALAAYPVGLERGFISRSVAAERTLATLRFFWNSRQGPEPDATGHRGFYYHFLDMQTGRPAWQCELSTVDSAFLLAGALTAGMYFDAETADEREIRDLGEALYRRADWQWAQNHGATERTVRGQRGLYREREPWSSHFFIWFPERNPGRTVAPSGGGRRLPPVIRVWRVSRATNGRSGRFPGARSRPPRYTGVRSSGGGDCGIDLGPRTHLRA